MRQLLTLLLRLSGSISSPFSLEEVGLLKKSGQ